MTQLTKSQGQEGGLAPALLEWHFDQRGQARLPGPEIYLIES